QRVAPRRHGASGGDEPHMYEGDDLDTARQVAPRWLLAGAMLAVPAVWHPAFLPLLLCPLGARPHQAKRQAASCLALGAAATLAVGVLAGGGLARWAVDLHPPA